MKKILFILFLPTVLLFSEILLSKTKEKEYIFTKTEIYISKIPNESFSEILNKKFKAYNKDYIKKGFSKETIWIKFKIVNNNNDYLEKVITTDNYILNSLILYTKEKKGYSKKSDGINRTNFRTILRPHFVVSLKPYEEKTFILKISSDSTPLNFSLLLLNKKTLYDEEFKHQLILALFFGSILTLIIYNLMIYIFSKDISYIYYVLYLSSLTIYYLYYSNMLFYIIGFSPNFIGIFILSFILLFIILFVKEFLNLKKYEFLNKTLNFFIIFILFVIIFVNKNFYPIEIIVIIYLFILFYLLFIGYYLLKKQYEARYFVIGWTIAILGFLNLALFNLGFINLIEKYLYFYEFTIFLEGIIFSLALVNKLNTTKKLALEVEKNKILIKEIHHRVKNNMQFIISLYRIKLSHKIDEQMEHKINEIENTIQSMGKAYELLYNSKNLEFINVNDYFDTLINELKKTFYSKNISIKTHIETNLSIDQAITCGIIINESISNCFKHAFPSEKGKIEIILIKLDSQTKLIIKDNGIGMNTQNKSGFGLFLLENLVKTNLKGNFCLTSKNGVEIKILF